MWGESRFNLTQGYLWLWSFVPSSRKWIRLSKLPSYFSFKTPSFIQFSMAVAPCYNSWNLNTSAWRNARRIGFDTSSGMTHTDHCIIDKKKLITCTLILLQKWQKMTERWLQMVQKHEKWLRDRICTHSDGVDGLILSAQRIFVKIVSFRSILSTKHVTV